MKITKRLLILSLVGFSISLSVFSQRIKDKVKGDGLVWQEATSITSGEKYLITAFSEGDTYYLPVGKYSAGPKGTLLDFNITNIKRWTFTFVEDKGYLISDDSNNVLYCRESGTNPLVSAVGGGSNDEYKYWTLTEDNELTTGVPLVNVLCFGYSNLTWFGEKRSDRITTLKFCTLAEENASSFAAWIMGQESGDITTPQCSSKYERAKDKWNTLSSQEQDVFKSDLNFSEARSRLSMWANANNETITEFYNNNLLGIKEEKENNSGVIILILSSLLLGSSLIFSKRVNFNNK